MSGGKEVEKDLIKLRDASDGKEYFFACRTCINGHRAPTCNPTKHRDRIMIRRPLPGRPSQVCSIHATRECECSEKRTLHAKLSSSEWDAVIAGQTPTVQMYKDLAALEAARHNSIKTEDSPRTGSTDSIDLTRPPTAMSHSSFPSQISAGSNHSFAANMTGSPMPMQMSPMASLQQHMIHDGAQMSSVFAQSPISYPDQPRSFPQQTNGYSPSTPSPFNPYTSSQATSASPLAHSMHMQSPYIATQTPQQLPFHLLHQQKQVQTPQPPIIPPVAAPTQACCSSKRRAQAVQANEMSSLDVLMQQFGNTTDFLIREPWRQFPCASCASTLCTCLSCPSTMQQSLYGNGAWGQSCGRAGHLDPSVFASQSNPALPAPHTNGMFEPTSPPAVDNAPNYYHQSILPPMHQAMSGMHHDPMSPQHDHMNAVHMFGNSDLQMDYMDDGRSMPLWGSHESTPH